MKKYTPGDRVLIVGGKYRGFTSYFIEEAAHRYRVKVDGKENACCLDKKIIFDADSPQEPAVIAKVLKNECKHNIISVLKDNYEKLQQELDELKSLLELLDI
jgi:hypothetical protein